VGETLQPLRSAADVARLARTVELTRTAVGHLLNARSSRSHCLVHLHLTEQVAGGGVTRRQLLFVDLAGLDPTLHRTQTLPLPLPLLLTPPSPYA
jgi:hypothetical protein